MKQHFLLALGLTAIAATTPISATSDDFEESPSTANTSREIYSDTGNIPIKISVNDIGQESNDDQGIESADGIEGAEVLQQTQDERAISPDLSIDQKKKSLLI